MRHPTKEIVGPCVMCTYNQVKVPSHTAAGPPHGAGGKLSRNLCVASRANTPCILLDSPPAPKQTLPQPHPTILKTYMVVWAAQQQQLAPAWPQPAWCCASCSCGWCQGLHQAPQAGGQAHTQLQQQRAPPLLQTPPELNMIKGCRMHC
jgi:hypothetical protein